MANRSGWELASISSWWEKLVISVGDTFSGGAYFLYCDLITGLKGEEYEELKDEADYQRYLNGPY